MQNSHPLRFLNLILCLFCVNLSSKDRVETLHRYFRSPCSTKKVFNTEHQSTAITVTLSNRIHNLQKFWYLIILYKSIRFSTFETLKVCRDQVPIFLVLNLLFQSTTNTATFSDRILNLQRFSYYT